jgi:uncharacterized membrane protein YdjX (TVP38/TMEM64 family)
MKQKHRFVSYVVFIGIILVLGLLAFVFPQFKSYLSPQYLKEVLQGTGVWGYFILVGLMLIAVPLPTPSTPVILAGSYIYGVTIGTILAVIGKALGGTIAFFLVRRYGKPLLEKMIDKHHLDHLNHIFKKRGKWAALISFAIPVFPSDVMSSFLGLTNLGYFTYLFFVVVGHIPRYYIINKFAFELTLGISPTLIVVVVLGLALLLVAIFRERVKRIVFKEIKDIEKSVSRIERVVIEDVKLIEQGFGLNRNENKNDSKDSKERINIKRRKKK